LEIGEYGRATIYRAAEAGLFHQEIACPAKLPRRNTANDEGCRGNRVTGGTE